MFLYCGKAGRVCHGSDHTLSDRPTSKCWSAAHGGRVKRLPGVCVGYAGKMRPGGDWLVKMQHTAIFLGYHRPAVYRLSLAQLPSTVLAMGRARSRPKLTFMARQQDQ